MVTDHRIIGGLLSAVFEETNRLAIGVHFEVDPTTGVGNFRIVRLSLLRSLHVRERRIEIATILGIIPG